MATLYARVTQDTFDAAGNPLINPKTKKQFEPYKQVLVDRNRANRYVAPANATSYFIRTRKEGLAETIRQSGGKPSYKNFEDAVVELARVEALELSPKLLEQFQANVAAQPVIPAVIAAPALVGTWASLRAEYEDHLRLQVKKGALKASSQKRYLRSIREFDSFLTAKGISNLQDITTKLFNIFKEHRIDAGAENAFVVDVKNLNPLFEYAVKHEMIVKNPVEYENPKDSAKRGAQPFSSVELGKLVQQVKKEEDSIQLAFWLMLQTGLRRGDAMDLRWESINGFVTRVAEKNGKKIRIPIRPELKALLDAARLDRNPKDADFVLLNPDTKNPYHDKQLYLRMVNLGKDAGVKQSNPHRFRDSFGADAFLRGCSTEEVAEYLGDEIQTVIKHYSEFITERKDRADVKLTSGKGLLEAVGA
jgi:integrase